MHNHIRKLARRGEKNAGYGCCWFTLEDCPWDTAELELAYTRFAQLDEPVEVPVK